MKEMEETSAGLSSSFPLGKTKFNRIKPGQLWKIRDPEDIGFTTKSDKGNVFVSNINRLTGGIDLLGAHSGKRYFIAHKDLFLTRFKFVGESDDLMQTFRKLLDPGMHKDEHMEESFRMGPIGGHIDPDTNTNGDLAPLVVDLGAGSSRRGDLDESFLRMFGSGIQAILRRMFGGPAVPVTVKGTRSQIDSFSKVLSREKKYLETWSNLGLDNPATYKSKFKLDTAVRQFERATGINYPFK